MSHSAPFKRRIIAGKRKSWNCSTFGNGVTNERMGGTGGKLGNSTTAPDHLSGGEMYLRQSSTRRHQNSKFLSSAWRIVYCSLYRLVVKVLMLLVGVVMQQKERSQIILIEIRGSPLGNNRNTHKYLPLINRNRLQIFTEPSWELGTEGKVGHISYEYIFA